MKYLVASFLFMVALIGCGGSHSVVPIVKASGPLFSPEFFYFGPQETQDYLWFATDQACDIGTDQTQSYILKFNQLIGTLN